MWQKGILFLVGIVVVLAVYLYSQYIGYSTDRNNICVDGSTTLASIRIQYVVLKKSDENQFLQNAIRTRKCILKKHNIFEVYIGYFRNKSASLFLKNVIPISGIAYYP